MSSAKLAIVVASLVVVSAADALGRGGGGGPGGVGGGIGGLGGSHAGSIAPGVPSPPSLPTLPSPGTISHLPSTPPHGLPNVPSAKSVHSQAKNKARGLNRAMSRMSPQGAKNTNNPLSPNRAHGRARAEERHALLDRPGRR